MELSSKQLKALEKLQELAAQEFERRFKGRLGDFHTLEYQKLTAVPGLIRHVKESHMNPYCRSSVDGALETLREVVRMFHFDMEVRE